ncbi:pollen receptor-like kinase 1 [Silene latifolia]|uniref:pollen receptor-like kinase 1 n=1 Tax=Silene latifolia TaxID=37657 RepID=UPI003D775910
MAPKGHERRLFLAFSLITLHIVISYGTSSPLNDVNALLKFKESLEDDNESLTSWGSSTFPCFGNKNNWVGIICSRGGSIWGLRLENMKLKGAIDVDSLTQLPRLRSVSFINNKFGGQLPDFRKLRPLKTIFLSHNNFEGTISPNAFEGMKRLRKVHLEYNKFSGEFPTSLTTLSKLVELRLEGNNFQGLLPDLKLSTSLHVFNVSNNQFQGPIPVSLAKFGASAFSGNKELCGPPLQICTQTINQNITTPPTPQLPKQSSLLEKPIPIIAIIFGVIIAMILAIMVIIMVLRSRGDRDNNFGPSSTTRAPRKSGTTDINHEDNDASVRSTTSVGGGRNKSENGKLTFIRDDIEKFDLPDLLKASAEILGSGCFGSSYKATLTNGNAVVVKRFKKMNNVGRDEFQEHMRRLGRLSHPNLLTLLAYYYRKEEKLFITKPMPKGSLAALLHGQARGKTTLDWPTRLKVIKGVVRGISYLYMELPVLVAPHGHLKSSNVLLNDSLDPVLSDYGLIPLINQESVQEMMVAYKSPEYFNNGRVTKKTDVWALGILIIEILTGKFPAAYLQQGSEVDMSSWVASVVDEGFDKNMGQIRNSEGEMGKLLQIGINCCETNIEKRLDIKEVCDRIEEVRERDNDDDFYSTCGSTEADVRSSRGMSDDFTLIIN